jgi:ribosomal protein L31
MKKALLFLVFVAFFISCTSNDKKEVSKPEVTDVGNKTFDLAYKFKVGDKFSYKMKTVSGQGQEMKTDSTRRTELNQTVDYKFDFEVREVDADKNTEFSVVLSDINVEVNVNGKKHSFHGGKTVNEEDKKNFIEYEAMYKVPFGIRINKVGEIIEVFKTSKIVDKIIELQGLKDSVKAEEKQQYLVNINETALKPLIQQFFRRLPEKKVGKDSTWSFSYPSSLMVYKLNNTTNYTVRNFLTLDDELLANIDLSLNTSYQGQNKVSERGVNYTFGEPKITGSGNILFNIDRGLMQKAETSTKLELSLLMQAKGISATRKDFSGNNNYIELIK